MQSINRTRPPDAIQKQTELSRLIARTEESVATGKKFNRPSEAPSAWLEISTISKQATIEDGWASNIGRARILSQQAESTIDTLSNGAARVRELMILANSETLAQRDRDIIALELESFRDQFNKLSLSQDNYGGYLFHPGDPIQMRIDADVMVTPAPTRQEVFGDIDLGGAVTGDLDVIMADMIDAVRTGNAADRSDQLGNAKSISDHFATVIGRQGVQANRLDEQELRLQESKLHITERLTALEGTDVTEAIAQFKSLLVNLEAAQQLYAQTGRTSLIKLIG